MDPVSRPVSPPQKQRLSALNQRVSQAVLLILGILPSILFFLWIERNMAIPVISRALGWPWVQSWTWPLVVQQAWNFGLFLLFGVAHSAFAQASVRQRLWSRIPVQLHRATYTVLTGGLLVVVMGFWQNSGIVLWALPASASITQLVSVVFFGFFSVLDLFLMHQHGMGRFLGWDQISRTHAELHEPEVVPPLLETGIYAYVRHPIYTFTLAAVCLAPVMTLDRAILAAIMILYLRVAIPIEERKLVSLFGSAYEAYRAKVPALFPFSKA